jgi:hypothetical protein
MTADKDQKNLESPDDFERMFAELRTPESKLRFEQYRQFLRRVIYAGLKDLNSGFDSPLIGHSSPEDFLTVIDRCESLNVDVIGIEVFYNRRGASVEGGAGGYRNLSRTLVRLAAPTGTGVLGQIRHHHLCDLRCARCTPQVKPKAGR